MKKELTFFDLTNIIVGSYVASALTVGLVGPFSIVVWLIAGTFAMIIALIFAYCSLLCSKSWRTFCFCFPCF